MNTDRFSGNIDPIFDAIRRERRPLNEWDLMPTDLNAVARVVGVRVVESPEIETGAGTGIVATGVCSHTKTLIQIDGSHPLVRRRFSIAHELGHFCLHRQDTDHFRLATPRAFSRARSNSRDHVESEANRFAIELLCPAGHVALVFSMIFGVSRVGARDIGETEAFHLQQTPENRGLSVGILRGSRRDRALAIARARYWGGFPLRSLTDVFGVAAITMARRLEELDLV